MTATPRPTPGRSRRPIPAPAPPRASDTVRWPRIANARARVAAGWYDRAEVRAALVDALIEALRRR